MHSWAMAFDIDALSNRNRDHWPTAASMPIIVMEVAAKHGFKPAGAFWSRDAMHFEYTL